MGYRYQQGDRPLPGYTIQRGVGRGGFGEVYYAMSDGGKEVAIKHLRENPQVELRGVQHVLNLKSPHLVAIHDIKQNAEGDFFVIMEYVNGPSLRDLMNDAPNGLGPQKAAYFAREIAKGLAYLHDRGIVHRDIKPGNIFYEDGYVKIGDYGLSKFMAASQHSGQTVSVGTVHYMAPEVGSGNYDRTIDVYALGVMLYEMLLGRVPFGGSSMGEVLMKHLTAQPEVDELQPPFPDVIRKALAKDPKDRYQTVDELVGDLFAEEDLNQSVAAFEPQSLSVRAARAADEIRADRPPMHAFGTGSSNVGEAYAPPVLNAPPPPPSQAIPYGGSSPRLPDHAVPLFYGDAPHVMSKVVQCLVIAAGLSFAFGVICGNMNYIASAFAITTLMAFGIYIAEWLARFRTDNRGNWWPKLVVAFVIAVPVRSGLRNMFPEIGAIEWLGFFLVILCVSWRGLLRNGRTGNRSLRLVFVAGLLGFVFGFPFAQGELQWGLAIMAATAALCVQTLGQLWPAEISEAEVKGRESSRSDSGSMQHSDEWRFDANETMPARGGRLGDRQFGHRGEPVGNRSPRSPVVERQRRGPGVRMAWAAGAVLTLGAMLFCFIFPNVANFRGNDWNGFITIGVVLASAFLFCLTCVFPAYHHGLWRGVFRQAIFFGGTALCSGSGTALGLFNIRDDVATAFMVAGVIGGGFSCLLVWLIPVAPFRPRPVTEERNSGEDKSQTKAKRFKVAGSALLGMCIVVTVSLLILLPEHDWDDVVAPTGIFIGLAGLFLLGFGIVSGIRSRKGPDDKLELPLRRDILLDDTADIGQLLDRFAAMHNYRMSERAHLFWTFRRGAWIGQLFNSDVRKWKTQLNLAAFANSNGGYTLRCILDVDAEINSPGKRHLRRLSEELDELERLVLSSSSSVGIERNGEVAV